jgi:hypothetical protein
MITLVLHKSCPTFLGIWACTYCVLTFLVPFPGNIESITLNEIFLVSLFLKSFTLQIVPADSTWGDSLTPFDSRKDIIW